MENQFDRISWFWKWELMCYDNWNGHKVEESGAQIHVWATRFSIWWWQWKLCQIEKKIGWQNHVEHTERDRMSLREIESTNWMYRFDAIILDDIKHVANKNRLWFHTISVCLACARIPENTREHTYCIAKWVAQTRDFHIFQYVLWHWIGCRTHLVHAPNKQQQWITTHFQCKMEKKKKSVSIFCHFP